MRRGIGSLLEIVTAILLVTSLSLLLLDVAGGAHRFGLTVRSGIEATSRRDRLREGLATALRDARPVEALTFLATGAVVEGREPGGRTYALPDALPLRGRDGYWVIERQGASLLRRGVDAAGRVSTHALVDGVRSAEFAVTRDASGRPTGVEWAVAFTPEPKRTGFLAVRAADVAPWSATPPVPATRFNATGRDR